MGLEQVGACVHVGNSNIRYHLLLIVELSVWSTGNLSTLTKQMRDITAHCCCEHGNNSWDHRRLWCRNDDIRDDS